MNSIGVNCSEMRLSLLLLLAIFRIVSSQTFCSDFVKRENHTFYPLRHCQRSNKTQIGAINVNSLEKCAQYARNNRALAFNYGSKTVEQLKGKEPRNYFDVAAAKEAKKSNSTILISKSFNSLRVILNFRQ